MDSVFGAKVRCHRNVKWANDNQGFREVGSNRNCFQSLGGRHLVRIGLEDELCDRCVSTAGDQSPN